MLSFKNWIRRTHPAYSPSPALSEFYLFEPLEDALIEIKFANNDKVNVVVQKLLRDQPKKFFINGIVKLQGR